jgi:NAD(P)-dependent dehydrogenase (short-subunit alcohol dehydrogenase family)
MGQVDGKVAIVTGGASGIGAACAETLARESAKVAVTDIDSTRGQELVAKIAAAGGQGAYLTQDGFAGTPLGAGLRKLLAFEFPLLCVKCFA